MKLLFAVKPAPGEEMDELVLYLFIWLYYIVHYSSVAINSVFKFVNNLFFSIFRFI